MYRKSDILDLKIVKKIPWVRNFRLKENVLDTNNNGLIYWPLISVILMEW